MSSSGLLFFRIGCWLALATAALHLVVHVMGPQPTSEAERKLFETIGATPLALPGGAQRTFLDFLDGFSLSFSLFLSMLGGLGLIVAKRGREDVALMRTFVSANAIGVLVLLAISLRYFFLIPTACIGLVAAAFFIAALRK